jgi:hypothetical protein
MRARVDTGANAFDRLMQGLVRVPKAEVDEEERKWQEQRERLKKKGAAKGKKKRKGA